jgi:predicted Zn-dependent protease
MTHGTKEHRPGYLTPHRDAPIRLVDSDRFLSQDDCDTIARRVFALIRGDGDARVTISSWTQGELRWARNRVSLASERRDISIQIARRRVAGDAEWQTATTNQSDDVSIEAAVRAAERSSAIKNYRGGLASPFEPPIPDLPRPNPSIWSKGTYGVTTEMRGEVARALIEPAETKGMLSAGYLEARAGSFMNVSSLRPTGPFAPWEQPYVQWTQAQCSMTVRDPSGTASGWAGLSSYDWSAIDTAALAARALEKCVASQHPVALEPGRYTVVLEPQAVADLMELLAVSMYRGIPETGLPSPWRLAPDEALGLWRTKLGLKVVDDRITIQHSPTDPELGILPRPGMAPVTWIDHGVLTNLSYDREYALEKLNENAAVRDMTGYRMSGGDTSVEEMIRTTKRGLLVTRFSNVGLLDAASLLGTGLTRDGLWLIENGKISKAVKNLRFTESPLFVLNSLDQLGPPARVFRPTGTGGGLGPAIVPPLKARDFSFTSTIDAI